MAIINGTDFNDLNLLGSDLADVIHGLLGDDVIYGLLGNDKIYGDAGADYLYAGDEVGASDTLYGGADQDVLVFGTGGGGLANGGLGLDTVLLNWGGDNSGVTLDFSSAAPVVASATTSVTLVGVEYLILNTGTGNDSIIGGARDDSINVSFGDNTVRAGAGRDYIGYMVGGTNTLDGGTGVDNLSVFATLIGATTFTVTGTTATDGTGSVITGFESYTFFGSAFADTVTTGGYDDVIIGGDGNDTVQTKGGADYIDGGRGADVIRAGAGADTISGGEGRDTLFGGSENDLFIFTDASNDMIADFTAGDEIQILADLTNGGHLPGDMPAVRDGAPAGTHGQLFTRYAAGSDITTLVWDANGTDSGGETLLFRLKGDITLTGDEILFI